MMQRVLSRIHNHLRATLMGICAALALAAALAPVQAQTPSADEFNPGANTSVYSLALQPDGKILVGGWFSTLAGQSRLRIGRIINTEPATRSLTLDDSSITWLRSGASPEVWGTTFEISTNGTNWTMLGEGRRMSGGWELTGLALPGSASVRARGFAAGGQYNASGWFVEAIAGRPPVIVSQPASRTNLLGTPAAFSIEAVGSAPLSYQWRKDSVDLPGATNTVLMLTNVQTAQAGDYSVLVSNAYGSVASAPASLVFAEIWFEEPALQADGRFAFALHAPANRVCEIWASTNLENWVKVATLTNETGLIRWADAPTQFPARFYQVRQISPP